MGEKARKLLEEALALPPDERELLLVELMESLADGDAARIQAEWEAEIERRIRELDSGVVKGIPADEALRRIFGRDDDAAAG